MSAVNEIMLDQDPRLGRHVTVAEKFFEIGNGNARWKTPGIVLDVNPGLVLVAYRTVGGCPRLDWFHDDGRAYEPDPTTTSSSVALLNWVLLRRLGWSWIFPALGMYPSARRSAESDACRSWRGKSVEHRRSSERGDISKIAQAVSIRTG